MKRDLSKVEEEEKWREKANNRHQWKRITKVAVHRSDEYTSLTPTQGKPEEEQEQALHILYLHGYVIRLEFSSVTTEMT